MNKSFGHAGDPKITDYALQTFSPDDAILSQIRENSAAERLPMIQVGAMDGLHLEVLTRAMGARKAVEIGTLGGYSGTCLLRGMGKGSKLYTFEADRRHAEVARKNFALAGFAAESEVFVGPAIESLHKIEAQGPFDLVFIDADKEGYPAYLEWAAKNLRKGGVVLGDNTFAWGMIADDRFDDPEDERAARALQRFNHELAKSGKFRATILPTGEGLSMGVKL